VRASRAGAVLAVLALVACGGSRPPPGPGTTSGLAPDLRGRRVIVLPVQQNMGVRGDPDAEIAFGLQSRGTGISWILPPELEDALRRSPGLQSSLTGLPVGQFLRAEVERVGDPLFGELRRLSSLVAAEAILLPVQVSSETEEGAAQPTVRMWTALIEPRTGRMLWYSVLDGSPYPPDDPRGLASAVDELARTMLWYAGQ